MKFTPKSEEQVREENAVEPWAAGTYDFEVSDASDETSKAGNEMIKLALHVFNSAGKRRLVFDYLLESISYKLRHAAVACGCGAAYDSGTLEAADFVGHTGRLKLAIQPAKDNYDAKNTVRDYVVDDREKAKSAPPDIDDEIPF